MGTGRRGNGVRGDGARSPTPELVLLAADGVDGEGVGVLVARGDDGAGQGQSPPRLLGPRLLVDEVLQHPRLVVEHEEPGDRESVVITVSVKPNDPSVTQHCIDNTVD